MHVFTVTLARDPMDFWFEFCMFSLFDILENLAKLEL